MSSELWNWNGVALEVRDRVNFRRDLILQCWIQDALEASPECGGYRIRIRAWSNVSCRGKPPGPRKPTQKSTPVEMSLCHAR